MDSSRVVVTGLGVVSPNGVGLDAFTRALYDGTSGIRFYEDLKELKFGCQVGGIPQGIDELKADYFEPADLLAMNSNMLYAGIAAIDAWRDAGLDEPDPEQPDPDIGVVVGTGVSGVDTFAGVIPKVAAGKTRRLGSTMVEQIMASANSARLAGLLGLGNQVTTNSSACSTGTEAAIMAYDRIRFGLAKRMLAGGSEGSSHNTWACFDAMRVLDKKHNDRPEEASRPMSRTAAGFVPAAGAGLLMLESLESAQERGAHIYAEMLAGTVNCGGHRQGGSMTAPNPRAVESCVRRTIVSAGITSDQIDLVSGHLTATFADPFEVESWVRALELPPDQMPWINAPKSLFGHALGAAGGLECVAVVQQLNRGFVHASLNCEDLHDRVLPFEKSIPHETVEPDSLDIAIKASFGFGDVNSCVIFKKWSV